MSFLKNKKKRNYFALSAYIFIFLIALIGAKYFIQKRFKNLYKLTNTVSVGGNRYFVMAARTLIEQKRGLMFVKKLPERTGMLFIFKKEVDYPFWMKNTLIPLTVLFINKGKVVNELTMKPCKTPKCKFYEPFTYYKYALEISETNKNLIGKKVNIGGI